MIEEVEEIMDESESLSPKEYIKSLNIPAMLAFLPKAYESIFHGTTAKMYIQFCLYHDEWVLAGFREGDGALGCVCGISNNYNNALFMKTITDTGIGRNIEYLLCSRLSQTPEALAIRKELGNLFNYVSIPNDSPAQNHVSTGWFVKGLKNA